MPSTSGWRPLMSSPRCIRPWSMDCLLLAFPTSVEEIRIQQTISGHTISQSQRTFSLLRRCGAVELWRTELWQMWLIPRFAHLHHFAYFALQSFECHSELSILVMLWFGQSPESGGSVSDSGPPWRPQVQRHQRRHLGLCDLRKERQLRVEDVLLEPYPWCSWRQRTELQVFAAWCDYFSMSSISLYPTSCLKYKHTLHLHLLLCQMSLMIYVCGWGWTKSGSKWIISLRSFVAKKLFNGDIKIKYGCGATSHVMMIMMVWLLWAWLMIDRMWREWRKEVPKLPRLTRSDRVWTF